MKALKYFKINYTPFLPASKIAKILDFGCGEGYMLTFLQTMGYQNLNGADINSYEDWKSPNLSKIPIIKINDSFEYLRSIKGQYDYIVLKDVIYYFKDDEVVEAINLLRQALKPNGKILFDIFNGSVITGPFIQYKDFDIKLILTEHSLKTIIERGNLKIDVINGNITPITGFGSIVYKLINGIQQLWLKLVYFSERGIDSQNPKILTKKIIALASFE